MCGIVFVKRTKGMPANKSVFRRYLQQKSRGREGYGYIAVEGGIIKNIKRAKTEDEIKYYLMQEKAEEILFHHRYPTSTPNYEGTAHPIIVSNSAFEYDYIVVHNGVISNHAQLRKEHKELDFEYTTEYTEIETTEIEVIFGNKSEKLAPDKVTRTGKYNDSESLAWEFALVAEGWKDRLDIVGGSAIVVYKVRKDGVDGCIGATIESMFYGSNSGRPLVLETQSLGKKKKNKENKQDGFGQLVAIKSTGEGKDLDTDKLYQVITLDGVPQVSAVDFKIGRHFESSSYSESRKWDYNQSRNAYDDDRDRWSRDSVRQKMGFGKDDERDTSVPLLPHGEIEDVDIEDVFPDETRLAEIEDELDHALEEREAEGWLRLAEKLIEDMSRLEEEIINSTVMANSQRPIRQEFLDEAQEFRDELRAKQLEAIEVNDKLMELNMPIPSNFLQIISY